MNKTDKYLDQIQEDEEQLQELDPITAAGIALGAGTLMVLWNLIRVIVGIKDFKKSMKDQPKMSKKLNSIMGTSKWIVKVVPDKSPNAFAAGGIHVFITTGLMKLLNEREQMAVLLHEVYHNEKKHMPKKLAYEYSLYYMIIFIIASITPVGAAVGAVWLGYLAFQISLSILKIPYAIIVGRKHEYGADENTVKYGYADDLVSGFQKMEAFYSKYMKQQQCGPLCKLVNVLSKTIDEHPDMQKRIENVLRKKETAEAAKKGTVGAIRKAVFAAAGIKEK